MSVILDVLTIGLQTGAMYALIGLGLALVFKATKVLNFAHGEIGTSSAFIAFAVMKGLDGLGILDNPDAPGTLTGGQLVLAVIPALVAGAVLGVGTKLIIDRLKDATPVTTLVATIGVAVFMIAVQIKVVGVEGDRFPRFVDGNAFTLPTANVPISWHTLIILAVLGAAAALLAIYFKTPQGIALLATSQDPFAAELQGINVTAMATSAWGVAGALAAAAGLLGAGVFNQLTPGLLLSTFLIPSFTGALLGGITSMVGAVVGGLLLGLIVTTANQVNSSFDLGLPGPPQIAVLAALLLVLLLRPRGLLGTEA
ncbi:MAG: branched-chain amino acid ABC transporter permease [Euzebya sp.]